MTTTTQSPKERYGINIRPLPLEVQEAFRRQSAARGMSQATYFVALMQFAEACRAAFPDRGTSVDWIEEEFVRLGLARVIT